MAFDITLDQAICIANHFRNYPNDDADSITITSGDATFEYNSNTETFKNVKY